MSRFVLISPDAQFDQLVRAAVEGGLHGEVRSFLTTSVPTDPRQLLDSLEQAPEVLILGPGIPVEEALRLATVFDVQCPEISVVLAAEYDPELVVQAMRAGIRDVLGPSADIAQVASVLDRACQAHSARSRHHQPASAEPQEKKGQVIGVFSPKGGVGKTTVATNLAVGLGKIAPMGVVIVDLDLQFGDVASALSLDPEHTVMDAVSFSASQDTLVLKAFLTVHPAGLYALCASKNPADADHVTSEHIERLLDQLAGEFQYVIVDSAPGLTELALTAMERCTDAVWVSGMDVPSVRGLRTGLDVLKKLDILPETRHVVLNMADPKTGLTIGDIETWIGAPVDVSIPRSRTVAFSTNRGIPVLQDSKPDRAVKGFAHLARRFDPQWRAQPARKLHRRVVVR
ncbi:AAA family ATPase [Paeniglutamicibacter sulfureus]|uniref:AAA family ATPase n=1 Tax=Paeniglutamicibacter sulfureus TaxID=43666 RepID=UPI0026670BA7|nr:AAA family ATPase [Paeniglutamicibacter sulfureus]MDO2935609.1 AAA family ATPase [Paeniglutamicibacter sulfureus]